MILLPLIPTLKVQVLVTQSCLILCDPVDCSPSGSFVQGILQARILKQEVIPFSKKIVEEKALSLVQLFANTWTVAYQASPSMGFSRRE